MKITNRYVILAGLCAAGFLAGFSARRLSGNSPSAGRDGEVETTSGKVRKETSGDPRAKDLISAASDLRSVDTLETLVALDDSALYGRLALWLIDASEPEIAAFWKSYGTRGKRDPEINQLVFIHWTRLNPQSAMAAAVGTDAESDLWRAWAGHDPQVALKQNEGDRFVSLLSHWDENKIAELDQGFRALPDDQKRQVAIMLTGNIAPNNCPIPALASGAIRYGLMFSSNHARQFRMNMVGAASRGIKPDRNRHRAKPSTELNPSRNPMGFTPSDFIP